MYLSSIDLFGFKSFAHRTRIDFAPGITAIVGPNGCGKSNIVDAVRWVLGEQREATLRSERMENVIFGGAPNKRPLGMAEISLTLQDTNRSLPIEYEEVTVTRRLYRSGKSEYLLNKSVVRLKDLVNLFMDTGVGPDSYSIIELKMVEGIISEDPEEIRQLLDEATGVTRYKVQRKEALRRLLEARQDRERAQDILSEVEKQANNLKRQVAKVRVYRRLQRQVKQIQAAILWNNVKELELKIQPLGISLKALAENSEKTTAELNQREAELLRLEDESLQLENERRNISQEYSSAQSAYQILNAEKSSNEEETRLIQWRLNKNQEEREKIEQELKDVHEQIEKIKVDLQSSSDKLPAFEDRLQDAQSAFQKADGSFKSARSRTVSSQTEYNELRQREAGAIRSSEERKATVRTLQVREVELAKRLENIHQDLNEKQSKLKQVEISLAEKREQYQNIQNLYKEQGERKQLLQERLHALEAEFDHLKGQKDRIALQIEHYQELHHRSSPLYSGGGILAMKYPKLISATIGDELQVSEKYLPAVESSLQGMIYCRVVEAEGSFETLQQCLKSEKSGRAAILLGDPPESDNSEVISFAFQTGGVAIAEVIEGSTRISGWIRHFLRNIVYYDSLHKLHESASLAARHGYYLVNCEGDFTDGNGFWIIGNSAGRVKMTSGLSVRLKELARQLLDIEEKCREAENRIPEIRKELDSLESESADRESQLKELQQELDKETIHKLQLEAQSASARLILEQIKDELDQLPSKVEKLASIESAQEEEMRAALEKLKTLELDLGKLQEEESRLLDERELKRQAFANLQIEVEKARAEVKRAEDRHLELEQRQQRLNNRLAVIASEKESLIQRDRDLNSLLKAQKEKVTEAGAALQELHQMLGEIDLKRQDLQEAQRSCGSSVRELRLKLDGISEESHNLQLEKVQLETALKEEKARMQQVNLEEIDDISPDPQLLVELEKKLSSLEPLNLAAEDEFTEQKKRLDFLTDQIHDLDEAEASLKQTIETLNREAKERFDAGYKRINENFNAIFREIFEGGESALRLNVDDSLESRIEVLATPRGKKVGSLSLLSGGEKALTAISLLFAVYMEKPSPFCILDEVDAPLDDENTMRFCQLLNKFTPKTQFLVVTHNKRTMEVAKNLLGVTMEEDGISKIVPVQIS